MPPKRNREEPAVEHPPGLMASLLTSESSVKDIAHDYVQAYQEDQAVALGSIIELIMALTGSKAELTNEVFKSIGTFIFSSQRSRG